MDPAVRVTRCWNVVALTEYDDGAGTDGRVAERYAYTPYGEFVVLTGDGGVGELGAVRPTSPAGNLFAHQGLAFDQETEIARGATVYFSPTLQRLLQSHRAGLHVDPPGSRVRNSTGDRGGCPPGWYQVGQDTRRNAHIETAPYFYWTYYLWEYRGIMGANLTWPSIGSADCRNGGTAKVNLSMTSDTTISLGWNVGVQGQGGSIGLSGNISQNSSTTVEVNVEHTCGECETCTLTVFQGVWQGTLSYWWRTLLVGRYDTWPLSTSPRERGFTFETGSTASLVCCKEE